MPDEQSAELPDDPQNVPVTEGFASPASPAAPESPAAIPPGWYPEPTGGSEQRWWNGAAWTEHVAAHGAQHATSVTGPAPSKKRLPTLAIVGIVVGGIVVGGGLLTGVVLATAKLADSIEADSRAGTAEPPAATPSEAPLESSAMDLATEPMATLPEGWARTSILKGARTVAHRLEWEDISDLSGTDAIEQEAWDNWGIELNFDGAWKVGGDYETGYTTIYVESVVDVGGPSSARQEAQSIFESESTGLDNIEIASEGAVTTAYGAHGYLIEYHAPYYDDVLTNSVVVLVKGNSQVVIYVYGSEQLGTGTAELTTMLDSIWLN